MRLYTRHVILYTNVCKILLQCVRYVEGVKNQLDLSKKILLIFLLIDLAFKNPYDTYETTQRCVTILLNTVQVFIN